MDLSTLFPKDETVIQITHPKTYEPLDISITLAGPAHPVKMAFERSALDARFKKKRDMDASSLMAESESELVARTLSWTNVVLFGEVLECTPDNVAKVYGTPHLFWLRNQVAAAVGDTVSFFQS